METTRRLVGMLMLVTCLCVPLARACKIVPYPIVDPRPRPVIRPIPPPRPTPVLGLETRSHKVDIAIQDNTAQVTLEAVFYNPNHFRIEGTYIFPVEKGAALRKFSMWVNGKELKADLLPADKARSVYEDIVRRQKDPALLEYVGTGLLSCRIFPIEARADVRVKLHYTQLLRTGAGLTEFRYPLRSARPDNGKIGTLSAKITVKTGHELRTVYCPTHKVDLKRPDGKTAILGLEESGVVPDRDLQVFFMQTGADVGLGLVAHTEPGEDGYFLMTLAPTHDLKADQKIAKDVLFTIDTSGSMSGEKIVKARNALKFCLKNLNPIDAFNVITFSTTTNTMFRKMLPATKENVDLALKRTDEIEAGGGTAIDEALAEALKMLAGRKGLKIVVFLTDGLPTIGETDAGRILRNVSSENEKVHARIFAFGVGFDVNTDLIDGVARQTNGTQDYVTEKEDLEVKVSAFYAKIANPVLSDVKLDVKGVDVYECYPPRIPDLFKGSELTLLGRFRKGGKATVTLTGKVNEQTKSFSYNIDVPERAGNDFLPSLWALRKVGYLMESIRLTGAKQELTDEILKLGKRYGIMTPYTSFLVVEDEARTAWNAPLQRRRAGFERDKTGERAVTDAKTAARFRNAKTEADAEEARKAIGPIQMGLDQGTRHASAGAAKPREPRRMHELVGGKGASAARDRMTGGPASGVLPVTGESAAVKKQLRIRDRTFLLNRAEGTYYDMAWSAKEYGRPVEVKWFSKEFFEMVREHPELRRYLTEPVRLVICVKGKSYKLVP